MAATAFGIMLYSITDSMVLTIILTFSIVWVWGFFGGSFETYMFSSMPQSLKNISPIYHENRALIEILVQGKSDYILSALLYSGAIVVGCSCVSVFACYLRRLGRK
jgi:ABC-2 type transport system permease protein